MTTTPKIRCAIYTRKSTDEGLDQDFNSLDAQRESCANFIASQKQEGWVLVPDHYDDPAYSGGNMERPALQRLLQDIEAGKVDCIVTYKIDRLSRSLMDFAKLVEIFDRHEVTFTSVTQSFNTANSMGRLTLNMLLSFAQYEREVTAERIRDKYAASRKRGIWMGGHPPLGYDVQDRKLVINAEEAQQVRLIFKRFIQMGSATLLIKELTEKGITSKTRQLADGRVKGGKPIDKGTLYKILNNRVYLGEVAFKGEVYPGEHAPIIAQAQWDRVQAILKKNRRSRSNNSRNQSPAPLKGIIRCGHCNRAMRPTHTRKNGIQYRYYLCMTASKNSHADCPLASVTAPQVEEGVFKRVRQIIQAPEIITRVWQQAAHTDPDIREQDVTMALKKIDPIWDELFPIEQNRLLSLLVENVILTTTSMEVRVRVDGITSLVAELSPTP
uniref:Site-specific recombinases n=1 Tax=Magnetococcus massalia (strain MO-1) TaxID=451514 RepID=A0A1S7LHY9_MAGMO|nr:Site-specific recombinases [Candidatus Magnetococcus massalia]